SVQCNPLVVRELNSGEGVRPTFSGCFLNNTQVTRSSNTPLSTRHCNINFKSTVKVVCEVYTSDLQFSSYSQIKSSDNFNGSCVCVRGDCNLDTINGYAILSAIRNSSNSAVYTINLLTTNDYGCWNKFLTKVTKTSFIYRGTRTEIFSESTEGCICTCTFSERCMFSQEKRDVKSSSTYCLCLPRNLHLNNVCEDSHFYSLQVLFNNLCNYNWR